MPKKLRQFFAKLTHRNTDEPSSFSAPRREKVAEGRARGVKPESDIPIDQLANDYSPSQTALKSPFRADGRDQQRDQEFASGSVDERWNDEDRFTNKSGDPRIGTHGRSYEPGERRGRE
jgi:hypothetical protein